MTYKLTPKFHISSDGSRVQTYLQRFGLVEIESPDVFAEVLVAKEQERQAIAACKSDMSREVTLLYEVLTAEQQWQFLTKLWKEKQDVSSNA